MAIHKVGHHNLRFLDPLPPSSLSTFHATHWYCSSKKIWRFSTPFPFNANLLFGWPLDSLLASVYNQAKQVLVPRFVLNCSAVTQFSNDAKIHPISWVELRIYDHFLDVIL